MPTPKPRYTAPDADVELIGHALRHTSLCSDPKACKRALPAPASGMTPEKSHVKTSGLVAVCRLLATEQSRCKWHRDAADCEPCLPHTLIHPMRGNADQRGQITSDITLRSNAGSNCRFSCCWKHGCPIRKKGLFNNQRINADFKGRRNRTSLHRKRFLLWRRRCVR